MATGNNQAVKIRLRDPVGSNPVCPKLLFIEENNVRTKYLQSDQGELNSEAIFAAFDKLPLEERQAIEAMAILFRDALVRRHNERTDSNGSKPAGFGIRSGIELLGRLGMFMVENDIVRDKDDNYVYLD